MMDEVSESARGLSDKSVDGFDRPAAELGSVPGDDLAGQRAIERWSRWTSWGISRSSKSRLISSTQDLVGWRSVSS